jgi:hypothetical protein
MRCEGTSALRSMTTLSQIHALRLLGPSYTTYKLRSNREYVSPTSNVNGGVDMFRTKVPKPASRSCHSRSRRGTLAGGILVAVHRIRLRPIQTPTIANLLQSPGLVAVLATAILVLKKHHYAVISTRFALIRIPIASLAYIRIPSSIHPKQFHVHKSARMRDLAGCTVSVDPCIGR